MQLFRAGGENVSASDGHAHKVQQGKRSKMGTDREEEMMRTQGGHSGRSGGHQARRPQGSHPLHRPG